MVSSLCVSDLVLTYLMLKCLEHSYPEKQVSDEGLLLMRIIDVIIQKMYKIRE